MVKVEREMCKCGHVEDFHITRGLSGKQQCIAGHEIRYRNLKWKETFKPLEHGCFCRKFESQ